MTTDVQDLRRDVAELRDYKAEARAAAREAARRPAYWFAAIGVVLTSFNIAASLWIGTH